MRFITLSALALISGSAAIAKEKSANDNLAVSYRYHDPSPERLFVVVVNEREMLGGEVGVRDGKTQGDNFKREFIRMKENFQGEHAYPSTEISFSFPNGKHTYNLGKAFWNVVNTAEKSNIPYRIIMESKNPSEKSQPVFYNQYLPEPVILKVVSWNKFIIEGTHGDLKKQISLKELEHYCSTGSKNIVIHLPIKVITWESYDFLLRFLKMLNRSEDGVQKIFYQIHLKKN